MRVRRPNAKRRKAFTLLEVIIATMIVGMLAISVYRFVSTHLQAIRISGEIEDERESLQAVVRFLELQLLELQPGRQEALKGKPLKFRGLSNDEITWKCTAGSGLLTTAAPGEYKVTLTVQPVNDSAKETELGLRRQLIDPTKAVEAAPMTRGSRDQKYNWLPLVRPMAALEIRYFNAQRNDWQDTWNDPVALPALIRVRIWKHTDSAAIETLLPVPAARLNP